MLSPDTRDVTPTASAGWARLGSRLLVGCLSRAIIKLSGLCEFSGVSAVAESRGGASQVEISFRARIVGGLRAGAGVGASMAERRRDVVGPCFFDLVRFT